MNQSNERMDKMEQRIDRIEQKIDILINFSQQQSKSIEELKTKVDDNTKDIQEMKRELSGNSEKIEELKEDNNSIKMSIESLFELRKIDHNNIAKILVEQVKMNKQIKEILNRKTEHDLEHQEFHLRLAKIERKVQ